MTNIAPYGTWVSPITAADVASGQVPLSFPAMAGDEVWWQEGRPDEGGRTTIMARDEAAEGDARELLPAPFNARTRVHEYGGRSYLPVPAADPAPRSASPAPGFDLVFANFADQRLYRAPAGTGPFEPSPLTPVPPAPAALRYADLVLSPDASEVWCVRESHDPLTGAVSRAIVAVPLDGSAVSSPDAIRVLVTGADFFAFPTPSPDGTRLAWVNWDHPRMPWDGTELRVGPASGTTVGSSALVLGGPDESVLAPAWAGDDSLYVICDRSGWWNLYSVVAGGGTGVAGSGAPRPLCPREEEFAAPLWQLGGRPYGVLGDGRLAVLHGVGELRLGFLDVATGSLTDAEVAGPGRPYRAFSSALATSGRGVVAIAGGPATPLSVMRVTGDGTTAVVVRSDGARDLDPAYLPIPRQVALSVTPDGPVVHALVYPPASAESAAPKGELPPYIVWVHGGPTANVLPVLDLGKAYFTSRGIGVIDVNYGGSTGYGRAYRERLRGQWGVVDVEDAMNAALALSSDGEADRSRLGIRGGSAGGWTALAAVTSGLSGGREPVFAAAVSYYGVSDLKPFAQSTHDFEARYLDGLIGPLPAASALYDQRSPQGHVVPGTCPILLLQGLDDPIVTAQQSESIARDLAAHGIQHAYMSFAGESHGFRKAETIIAALEAELAFYGQIMGFTPPGVQPLKLESQR